MAAFPFVIPMKEYHIKDFVEAVEKTSELTEEIIRGKTALSVEYGKQFYPPDAFGEMINTIAKIARDKGGSHES